MIDCPILEPASAAALPRIVIRSRDAERLQSIAMNGLLSSPREAAALLDELQRASVQPDDLLGDPVVGLGETVIFSETINGVAKSRRAKLVEPRDHDPAAGYLSVLTPVGVALIGLSAGQAITLPDRYGGVRHFAVHGVLPFTEDEPQTDSASCSGTSPGPGDRPSPDPDPEVRPPDDASPSSANVTPFRRRSPAPSDEPDPPRAA